MGPNSKRLRAIALACVVALVSLGTVASAKWTRFDFVARDFVRGIAVDAQGHKWFATGKGVCCYDEAKWTRYRAGKSGLAHDHVLSVAIDDMDRKWFGTEGGASVFDGKNWTTFNTSNSPLANNKVWTIMIDVLGRKWFGTEGGVSVFDGSSWKTYNTSNSGLAGNDVRSIAIGPRGRKWFSTYKEGVSVFDGKDWETYKARIHELASNAIWAIRTDAGGRIWFATIMIDVKQRQWYGRTGAGVSMFDGEKWYSYDTKNSPLAYWNVMCIDVDSVDRKWFGTYSGVSSFRAGTWNTYNSSNSELGNAAVYAIAAEGRNKVWFGTKKGVWLLEKEETVPPLGPKLRAAVFPLKAGAGVDEKLAQQLTDSLRATLFDTCFDVLNRDEVTVVLKQKELNVRFDDEANWAKTGQALQDALRVDKMVFGRIGETKGRYEIILKLFDVDKAKTEKMPSLFCYDAFELPLYVRCLGQEVCRP